MLWNELNEQIRLDGEEMVEATLSLNHVQPSLKCRSPLFPSVLIEPIVRGSTARGSRLRRATSPRTPSCRATCAPSGRRSPRARPASSPCWPRSCAHGLPASSTPAIVASVIRVDGSYVAAGAAIATLARSRAACSRAERVALNFPCHSPHERHRRRPPPRSSMPCAARRRASSISARRFLSACAVQKYALSAPAAGQTIAPASTTAF